MTLYKPYFQHETGTEILRNDIVLEIGASESSRGERILVVGFNAETFVIVHITRLLKPYHNFSVTYASGKLNSHGS